MAARYDDIILGKDKSLAYAMLADPPHGATARHMWFLYHWRALHFGPKVVARDFAHAVDSAAPPGTSPPTAPCAPSPSRRRPAT